jgi:hypothetical protein
MESLEHLELSNFSASMVEGKRIVTGQVMSTELIPEEVLRRDIPRLKGKELRLEHAIIEENPHAMIGEVLDVWWDETINQPFAKAELFEDGLANKIWELILSDQDLPIEERTFRGFSIGIVAHRDKKTKQMIKFRPRELTITGDPVCVPCTISVGQFSMAENNIKLMTEMYNNLKKETDEKLRLLEEKMETMKKDHEREAKTFSASNEAYKDEISKKKSEIDKLTKDNAELGVEINSLKDDNAKLKQEQADKAKLPLVEALLEAKGYGKETEVYKTMREKLFKRSETDLMELVDMEKHAVEVFGQAAHGNVSVDGIPINSRGIEKYSKNGVIEVIPTDDDFDKIGGL